MIKSITELVANGYSEDMLRRIAHMPANPFFRINEKRGKFWCDEEQLKKFIKERFQT